MRRRVWPGWLVLVPWLAVLAPVSAGGQSPQTADSVVMTVTAAVDAALERSEEVATARARLEGASARFRAARSAALPQVTTQLAYTKTLRSVFQDAGGGFTLPDSLRFEPDTTAPLAERVRYLERRVPSAAFGALGSLFSDLPFGNENTWIAGLSVSQPLFTGGRIRSSIQRAGHGEDAATAGYEEAAADVVLEVRQAYYDAALAREATAIVAASVELAAEHLEQVRLRLDAGRASELEALRAEVELENLRPQLVQARNRADLAVLNLKRLTNVPVESALVLATPLVPAEADRATVPEVPGLEEVSAALRDRAAVRAARSQIEMQEEQLDIARAAYFPSISLTGTLSRQAFPSSFGLPTNLDWRDDWTVGFAIQWPLFQGLRRNAEVDAARAQVQEAQLQLSQLLEGVRIDYERAAGELERSRTQIAAARRTVDQAVRVYELTELRFGEGLATQLDISDARLALQQARLNEVQAYHDAYVALARVERALGTAVGTVER
ncbi:MAG: TolC family protein [Candidatus Longimicrobiales bacterium M2_2A_002]